MDDRTAMSTRLTDPAVVRDGTNVSPPHTHESGPPEPPADSGTAHPNADQRWWSVEWLGLTCGLLFFVGLFFAYRTYAWGLVTQAEFDTLQPGLTLAQVNDRLGFAGRRTSAAEWQQPAHRSQPLPSDRAPAVDVYRWENSTQSWVECHFLGGQLQSRRCCRLP
ncbi:MAG: hypothetical protein NXI04_21460 [Planctomycetaceae bacterium]|nr:hypothetical protein [Planctomycetaceae bacterium]